jgi:D-glycero-D-manno-heptose 1,7-bisphosphate phosphatase
MSIEYPLIHPLSQRLYLFDVDQTLRQTVVDGVVRLRPPNRPGEWQLLPNVVTTLARYRWGRDHFFGLCSNQGGVGLGFMDFSTAERMLWDTATAAFRLEAYAEICCTEGTVRLCPHAPKADCYCRKPSPWMLLDVMAHYARYDTLTRAQVLYVGDQETDREAAQRAGIAYCDAWAFFGWPPPEGHV